MGFNGHVAPMGRLRVIRHRPLSTRIRRIRDSVGNIVGKVTNMRFLNLKYTWMRARDYIVKFPARLFWTLRYALPAGLRGELTAAYCTLSAVLTKADGTVVNLGVLSRKMVTKVFVLDIVDAMVDSAGSGQHATFNDYKYHDSGVGVTAENNGDSAIETTDGESRVAGTQVDDSTASAGIYTSVGTISYTTSKAITEHGLFNASTAGQLLDRSVFAAVNVVNGDSIQFTYSLTINPE